METGLLEMSASERERAFVVRQVTGGLMQQKDAAARLGLSVRQVKRLVRAWRAEGAKGLVSRRRGRASPRRLEAGLSERIVGLLSGVYAGFGATLAAEKLCERDGITVSRETVRRLQIVHGLWRAKRRREKRVFSPRERRGRFGELVQIDGSPHDWFEGRGPRACLIVFIDDATNRLTALTFVPAESTEAYLKALKQHILSHGLPLAFYCDRHGIFRVNAKEAASGDGKTAFGRIAEALGIELIAAQTPQAKGRVERANQTLQDRLVKEMRLKAISSIAEAEAFLPEFIAWWNGRFAIPPREAAVAMRPWTGDAGALEDALAIREERVLSKALSFRARGQLYAIKSKGPGLALRGTKVTLLYRLDGTMKVLWRERALDYTAFGPSRAQAPAESAKSLGHRLDTHIAKLPAAA